MSRPVLPPKIAPTMRKNCHGKFTTPYSKTPSPSSSPSSSGNMAQPPSSPKLKNKTADQHNSGGWTKYINILGLLGFVTAIVYINPLTSDAPIIARANQFLKRTTGIDFQQSSSSSSSEAAFLAKYANGCPVHQYSAVKIVSRSPDIMVIENFVTSEEADYLVKFAYPPPLPPPNECRQGLIAEK